MIRVEDITAWGNKVPWKFRLQVEQDLIISRALVEIFSNDFLCSALRVRGGTALNKLHFPKPLRYSEDIDLVRTFSGPVGPVLDHLRDALEPWLGRPRFDQSPLGPKFRFRIDSADGNGERIRLKVEMNTREIHAFDGPALLPLAVDNTWFSGEAKVSTFSNEEMLATKMRALLQRDKGRDLYDLALALVVLEDLDIARIIEIFGKYSEQSGQSISRAQGQERMFNKLAKPSFLDDLNPLLPAFGAQSLTEEAAADMFCRVFTRLVDRLPGEPWANSQAAKDHFGISW